jgi:predicted transcriptional regulator
MAKAKLTLHRKRVYDDGSISEIKLWLVPSPVRGSEHVFKYSLFYGTAGERWIGYDNEAGKGDHRHFGAHEEVYTFTTPERLFADFVADVEAEQARRSDERKKDMTDLKVIVGGSLADDGAAFVDAWRMAERGEAVVDHVLAFESWEGLASVMTGERLRLLRHLHGHPEPSVAALARSLGRQYRRVHDDVVVLEATGLVSRADGAVRATADSVTAEVRLAA